MGKHHKIMQQVGALPIMRDGVDGLRVLLVTSRETKRWVIPKGWPMRGLDPWDAAAIEARQEAGILGIVKRKPIGAYSYFKRLPDRVELVDVNVYPLFVTRELSDWPERRERQSFWFVPRVAADLVREPELSDLIRHVETFGLADLAV